MTKVHLSVAKKKQWLYSTVQRSDGRPTSVVWLTPNVSFEHSIVGTKRTKTKTDA